MNPPLIRCSGIYPKLVDPRGESPCPPFDLFLSLDRKSTPAAVGGEREPDRPEGTEEPSTE
jgi:hypothetical protein